MRTDRCARRPEFLPRRCPRRARALPGDLSAGGSALGPGEHRRGAGRLVRRRAGGADAGRGAGRCGAGEARGDRAGGGAGHAVLPGGAASCRASGRWLLTQALAGIAHSVFAPAVAAITLGVAGRAAFTRRTGRNEILQPCRQCLRRDRSGGAVLCLRAGGGVLAAGRHGGAQHPGDAGDPARQHRPCAWPAAWKPATRPTHASGLAGAARLPAAAGLRRLRGAVPFRQCGDAAVGRAEAGVNAMPARPPR